MILGQNGRSDPSRAPPSRPGEGGGETSPSRGRKQVETGNAQDHLRPKGCVQRRGGRSRGGPGRGGTGGGVASPGISPLQLQDDVNRSVMIGASYLHDGMFSEFDRHPWDLTQGNIAENLRALRLRSEASVSRDYSTWKLKKALDKGTFLPNWPRQHIFYVFFCRLRRPAPPPRRVASIWRLGRYAPPSRRSIPRRVVSFASIQRRCAGAHGGGHRDLEARLVHGELG